MDAEMRAVFTSLGGYDRCVTEFVRVTEQKIPNHVFYKNSPELKTGGSTAAGVPVYVQLLGGNPKAMAFNARRLAKLNPPGIDLNFGCPSKTVNKREGGSVLLREPKRVQAIVASVRDSVDPTIPVTAKIRLGFEHTDDLEEIVHGIGEAGASELCVHARTKQDRYKPPAYWAQVRRVEEIAQAAGMPITVNGDIWSASLAKTALDDSGAQNVMLGRGALRIPNLAAQIKSMIKGEDCQNLVWHDLLEVMVSYLSSTTNPHPNFVGNRAKQWLGFLKVTYPEAEQCFNQIKYLKEAEDVIQSLCNQQSESVTRRN